MTCRSPWCDRPAGRPRHGTCRGWCGPCYDRWRYHGRPGDGPPAPRGGSYGPRAGRVEDYAWLRGEQAHSLRQAAERLGVSQRTAERYEAELRRAA